MGEGEGEGDQGTWFLSKKRLLRRPWLLAMTALTCNYLMPLASLGHVALLLMLLAFAMSAWCDTPRDNDPQFRICADPNNLPFSNRSQEGFENKIADLLAHELHQRVVYTWWPQRRGFVRNTLQAGACDVVMGVPAGYDPVLTTPPYYRSTYVFVYRKSAGYRITSFDDPPLRTLKIGVHLIGDDYANSPPAHLLSTKGIVENVVGYSVYGDYGEDSPPGKIIAAVAAQEIDVAIVWGPIAGYFAKKQAEPLTLVPVPANVASPSLPFSYNIALGVRRGDEKLKTKLAELLQRKAPEIQQILVDYGVPTVQD
jgi:quinoprotein dehydrogenase-associated probable ABC transporter substrate-binding protein